MTQDGHEAVPIVNGGASTEDGGTHSPEPWTFGYLYVARKSQTRYDNIAMHPSGEVQPEGGVWEADARRIVACVNACGGISTAALEDGCQPAFAGTKLLRQRDELAEALRGAVEVIKQWHNMAGCDDVWPIYLENSPEMKPIREALAASQLDRTARETSTVAQDE